MSALERHQHPASLRRKLVKAGLSEGSTLSKEATTALDRARLDLSPKALRDIAQGKTTDRKPAPKPKPPKPEPKAKAPAKVKAPAKPTAVEEALKMLRERGPMHYRDLTEALIKAGRIAPTGKTPAQTMSAALGRHPDAERVAQGVYKAKEKS